jgi:hypothetical protein
MNEEIVSRLTRVAMTLDWVASELRAVAVMIQASSLDG